MWLWKMYLSVIKIFTHLCYQHVNLENKPFSKNKQDKQTSLPMI